MGSCVVRSHSPICWCTLLGFSFAAHLGWRSDIFWYQHEDRGCAAADVLAGPMLKIIVQFSNAAAKR